MQHSMHHFFFAIKDSSYSTYHARKYILKIKIRTKQYEICFSNSLFIQISK
jgi:hypothetical protein